jgi:hypothetical protein
MQYRSLTLLLASIWPPGLGAVMLVGHKDRHGSADFQRDGLSTFGKSLAICGDWLLVGAFWAIVHCEYRNSRFLSQSRAKRGSMAPAAVRPPHRRESGAAVWRRLAV